MSCVDRSHLTEIVRYDKVDEILADSIRSGKDQLYEWGRRHSIYDGIHTHQLRCPFPVDWVLIEISPLDETATISLIFWSLLSLTTSHTQINVLLLITDKSMDLHRVCLLIRIPFIRFPLEPIRVQVSGLFFVSKSNEIEIIFSCCCKEFKKKAIFF